MEAKRAEGMAYMVKNLPGKQESPNTKAIK
jgi:hypothetical protein